MELGYLNDLEVFVEVGRAPTLETAGEMLKDDATAEAISRLAKRLGFQVVKRSGLMTTAGANLLRQTLPALSVLQNAFDASVNVVTAPPMAVMKEAPDLHDAALLRVDSDWKSGEVLIWMRVGGASQAAIKGLETSRFDWHRSHPWGPSGSINEVRGPIQSGSSYRLDVEMQSGDTLVFEAREFEFGRWE